MAIQNCAGEKRTILTGVKGRPEVCFEIEKGANLFITYAAMSVLTGESFSVFKYRLFTKKLTPLQAIRREGMAYKRRRSLSGNKEWRTLA